MDLCTIVELCICKYHKPSNILNVSLFPDREQPPRQLGRSASSSAGGEGSPPEATAGGGRGHDSSVALPESEFALMHMKKRCTECCRSIAVLSIISSQIMTEPICPFSVRVRPGGVCSCSRADLLPVGPEVTGRADDGRPCWCAARGGRPTSPG